MTGSLAFFVAGACRAAGGARAAGAGAAGNPHDAMPCCIIMACKMCGGSIGMGGSIPWWAGIRL
jgi:hypothetical protein